MNSQRKLAPKTLGLPISSAGKHSENAPLSNLIAKNSLFVGKV
jgi:hypothetical protein